MPASVFFDSNTLLYLLRTDENKADRMERLLIDGGIVSVQVLNEILNVCVRKYKLDWERTDAMLASVRNACQVVPLDEATHVQGRSLAERYQLSIYDAMIVAAAHRANVKVLYSEDMQDGLVIEQALMVRNPFTKKSV